MSDKEGSPRHRSRTRSRSRKHSEREKFSKSRSRSRSRHSRGISYRSRSKDRRRGYVNSRSRTRSPSRRRYSRSRSRSPYYSRRRSDRRSRSRSYSPRYRGDRTRSRSPLSRRRRHIGSRDRPKTSRCLGVFGLSLYTTERDVKEVISRYGPIETINLVHDHQTGRSRGFCFLYMRNLEDAVEAKERAPGTEIDGHKIRVDYSITERAHTPTPGVYLGRPTSRGYRSDRYSRRSSSPYQTRSRGSRYSRSRSRSRSYSRY